MRWRETPLVLRIYSPTRFRACVPLQPPVEVASASVAHGRWCVVVHLYRLVGPGRNCCCSCCKHVGKLEHMRVLGRWRLEPPPQVTMLDVAVCS